MSRTSQIKIEEQGRYVLASETAVAAPASGLTSLAIIKVENRRLLCFHFDVATQNVDDFDVLVKSHPDATAVDITPTDWTSLTSGSRFLFASGNLAAVAAAAKGYFEMDVAGLHEVEIKVSGAVNNASVTPRWSLS